MTPKQLAAFVTVAQEKTISAAAEKLHLTKPAVSMAISELEKQLGQPLFDRQHNRLHLNQQGARLLPYADELLTRQRTIKTLFNQQSLSGTLTIGASDTLGNQVLPFLIRGFEQHTGHTQQQLRITNTNRICEMLSAFELDIGLVEGHIQQPQLVHEPWRQDMLCVIAAPNHPLAQPEAKVSLSKLENSQWILREPGSGSRDNFFERIAPRLRHYQIRFELNSTEAIINAVSAGLGFSIMSLLSARHALAARRVSQIQLPLDLSRHYHLVYHQEKYLSPLLSHFLDFCRQWHDEDLAL
ncbi:HTH-type transcriptional regulator CysL [Vibrio stylophorae]|uniref:HTH-type transcriptional regulator CysL n=1 Tax=Vibrio stylophorae TaxID=659351 RepID=A0ABN8DT48_9VIBR|nr:LysR family transcriptional regulator [Vibrio stylophorae]CAH0534271.1 HTH-type transcriptional regulator CysL [Vibrio stylophorae]